MGKIPSTIFRELYRKSKDRTEKIGSADGENPVYAMSKQDGCYYVSYKEVMQRFLIEGYSEKKAMAHIQKWIDYDLIFQRYNNGYKYIGFVKQGGMI